MKWFVAALLATLSAFACDATTFVIDASTGQDVLFTSFSPVIPFSTLSLTGGSADFTVSFDGFITRDARSCLRYPPGLEPADCYAAIDPISMITSYTATPTSTQVSFVLPFGLSSGRNGLMHFTATNGGSVFIDVAGGQAVPEPAPWALMMAGFGLTGAALRMRRKPVSNRSMR